jgi:predicted DCC family thiol-disulfide oxidoreductase YuxK
MKNVLKALNGFFFAPIDARGFGLMRVTWAFCALLWMGMQWVDVAEFYSNAGVIPQAMEPMMLRADYRFTLLTWVTTPDAVFALYLLMLFCFLCMMIGVLPRLFTIASMVLLFSFHERNPLPYGGGDTVLRVLGMLLIIAPCIDAFSVERLRRQWKQWQTSGTLLAPPTMAIWPYRLLLWQFVVLYGTSLWFKLMGTMWRNGTAVASALHHPVFTRFPKTLMDVLTPFMPLVDFATLAWQGTWLLLLIPKPLTDAVLPRGMLKRLIIVGGVLFHGSILILMDAGSFSIAIFSGYCGLLLTEDFDAMRAWVNGRWQRTKSAASTTNYQSSPRLRPAGKLQTTNSITVLFDGRCVFCRKSIFVLQILDHLRRLSFVNFYDAAKRKQIAPEIPLENLQKAMHVMVPPTTYKLQPTNYQGFDAFRVLCWHLPALWPLAPLLYLPGVPWIGRATYGIIARRRHTLA